MDCREYLQVTTLADITTVDGKEIMLQAWQGTMYKRKVSSFLWPRQPPHKHLNWDLWRATLQPLIHNTHNRYLKFPLGRWESEALHHWKWFYSCTTNKLYAKHGQVYTSYVMISRGSRRNDGNYMKTTGFCQTLPQDLYEADVYFDWSYKLLSCINTFVQPTICSQIETLGSLQEAIQLSPTDDLWAIKKMWSQDQGLAVAQAITKGMATGISDGSFKHNRGTAACILEANNDSNSRIYAVHDTPGNSTDQSPYRSELGGISMMLLIIQGVIRYHGITKGSIKLGLDGKKAMEQASGSFILHPKQRSFDMLVDIRKKIALLPITITFFWVEGHQLERHGKQSYMGDINDKCDYLAKQFWQMKAGSRCLPNQLFHHSPWTISYKGKVAAYLNQQELYDHTYGKTESVPYWQDNRQPFPPEHERHISWLTIHQAMKQCPWGKTKWQSKLWTGFAPVGRVLKRRHEWNHDMCPRCLQQNETCLHVLQCPADTSRTQWEVAINELEDTLIDLRTNPNIIRAWKSRLLGWQDHHKFPFRQFTLGRTVYSALHEQDAINWSNFLMGRLSKKWKDAQDEWIVMTSTKWKRSSQRWFTKAVLAIWEVSWKQWQHRNSILHDEQHPWKQRDIGELDKEIQLMKLRYHLSSYLPRDRRLFDMTLVTLHQLPTPIKQQWLLSVRQAQVRKIAANVTPISQERQLLRNWLSSKSPTTPGRGQLTTRRCEQAATTTQSVPDNRSYMPQTRDSSKNKELTSYAQVPNKRLGSEHQSVYSTQKRPRLIPYSIVSSVNYQCGRLLKAHLVIPTLMERETTTVQLLSPSSQKRSHSSNVNHPSKKRKQQKDHL